MSSNKTSGDELCAVWRPISPSCAWMSRTSGERRSGVSTTLTLTGLSSTPSTLPLGSPASWASAAASSGRAWNAETGSAPCTGRLSSTRVPTSIWLSTTIRPCIKNALSREGETEPCTLDAGTLASQSVERFIQVAELLRGHADPGVFDNDSNLRLVATHRDLVRPADAVVLDAVRHQVCQDLSKATGVRPDAEAVFRPVCRRERDAVLFGSGRADRSC